MNCTEQEFERIVHNTHPHKWMNRDMSQGFPVLFALDTAVECQLSYVEKYKIADYVWDQGYVIKDTTNLFSPLSTIPTYAFSFPYNPPPNPSSLSGIPFIPMVFDLSSKIGADTSNFEVGQHVFLKPLKCECGAHSVGSNRHSSWCEIKENA
jgi:hypothetical protein